MKNHAPESLPLLPLLYHAHHAGHVEDLPFWQELATRQNGPILELGCGTGRVLLALPRAGYPVYGLDHDAGMLSLLFHNLAPELIPKVHVWMADMTQLCLGMSFSLILLPCNTLSTLPVHGRRALFKSAHRHLSSGGLFAASLPNPRLYADLPSPGESEVEEIFPHPITGNPVQVSSSWRQTRRFFTVQWDYDHLLPDGRIQRMSSVIRHDRAGVTTYLRELKDAGFESISLYGDFDSAPYQMDSPYLILVASQAPALSAG